MAKTVRMVFVGDAGHLIKTFGTVEATAARSMANVQSTVSRAGGGISSGMGSAVAAIGAAGATMRKTGTRMTLGLTAPLAVLGKTVFGTAADFEQNMNVLQATSGATGEEMAAMGRLSEQLGADITLPGTSAADAAAAMLELSKAGLSVSDTMGAARGVLQLSAAGGIENAAAAEIAANALNAFALKGDQATRVADLLAATANASSADVADLADSLAMSGAVFAKAGIPIEDLITSVGLLANVGIKGSDAGTSLKTMLMRLQDPSSKEAAATMKELGLSVYDAQGRMRPMRDLIGQFTKALGPLSDEQRNSALATIFGADAVRAANSVLLAGAPAFDKMKSAATEEGAAAKLAAARNKGLAGAVDGLKSAMETFALQVVKPALPILTRFVNFLSTSLPKLAALPKPVKIAAAAFVGLLAAAGPLLAIFGAILSPIGLVAAAIAGLGGLVYAALNPGKTEGAFRTLIEQAKAFWYSLTTGFTEDEGTPVERFALALRAGFFRMTTWIKENGPVIAAQLVEWGKAFVEWVLPYLPPLLNELGKVLGAIGTWIYDVGFPWLREQLKVWIPAFIGWVAEIWPPLMGELGKLLVKLGAWFVTDALPKMVAGTARLGIAMAEGIAAAIAPAVLAAINFAIDQINRALAAIDVAAGPLVNFGNIPNLVMPSPTTAPGAGMAAGAPVREGGGLDVRARGGPVRAGHSYLVNDRGGPELLTMGGRGGYITSNRDLRNGASGGASSPNVTVNMHNNANPLEVAAALSWELR